MTVAASLSRVPFGMGRLAGLQRASAATLAIGLIGAAAASALYSSPSGDIGKQPMSEALRLQLPTMSTGNSQQLVLSGHSAQERNSRIPLAAAPLAELRGFTEISDKSPQYAAALHCLTQAVYYEAANEPESGKRAVAQVVLNRLRHPAYPNSVCGVVYEGASAAVCQFSFTCDGALLRRPMARQWQDSQRVAKAALAGSVLPQVGSATHYHADYVLPRWAFTLGKLGQIGAHIFYRFPGSAGTARAFADRWSGVERVPTIDFARLQRRVDSETDPVIEPEMINVPGLTVPPDVTDRHAAGDVGGRLDTTTGWTLAIPDPVQMSASYRDTVSSQGAPEGVTSKSGLEVAAAREGLSGDL